ncbi:uncharacterized protein [Argopecten irradians]|uniref:uncharacterized protein n=1 Tax=Argopecten irradians TaxID=31199 RepID=UPI00371D451E
MSSVREGLEMLKSWNPNWNAHYFMCDFDLREVGALESTFKGAQVLLCNFHRDQAWQRWLTANKIADKESVMKQLRAIARSMEITSYEACLEELRNSSVYKDDITFQSWFEKKWIANAKVYSMTS